MVGRLIHSTRTPGILCRKLETSTSRDERMVGSSFKRNMTQMAQLPNPVGRAM
jgi:hypothetical protein